MFKPTRRGFMVGCSAAIASFTGGLSFTAFSSMAAEPNQEITIVVFLRGGMDGLNLVPPISGPDRGYYEAKRDRIAVPTAGANAALPLNDLLGLHPAAAPLFDLYQSKHLAVVHAAGLTSDTRSHFDAMQYMELGTPGSKAGTTGWLTRHLLTANNLPSEVIMPAVATGNLQPTSLLGSRESIGMTTPNDFQFNGHWRYGDWQRDSLRTMYAGSSWLHQAGVQTLDAVDVVERAAPGTYTPGNGAVYPTGTFGNSLQTLAQIIKMQLGLRVATVDLGGWDTHEYQGENGAGYFANLVGQLATGLAAFYTDMSNDGGVDHNKRITLVVMSEFGRSFEDNASGGTDHGHGNVMLVLGGAVNGGVVHGDWPGLAPSQLYDGRDLAITTDYRRVLSELLIRRLGNPNLGTIFPGYTGYAPIGVLQGTDLEPIYTPAATPTPGAPTPTPGPQDSHKLYIPAALRSGT
jgi:uncharacterized protein (DUF1501 family)